MEGGGVVGSGKGEEEGVKGKSKSGVRGKMQEERNVVERKERKKGEKDEDYNSD